MDIFSDCKHMHLLLFCIQVILERLGVGTYHTLVEQADLCCSQVPPPGSCIVSCTLLCKEKKKKCRNVNAFIIVTKVAHVYITEACKGENGECHVPAG